MPGDGRRTIRMDIRSYLVDGLEKFLELERELGTRTFEVSLGADEEEPSVVSPRAAVKQGGGAAKRLDLVFLHDRPFSDGAIEMMSKIVRALGKTPETAPVVTERPVPDAKVYVALGAFAMRKFLPGKVGEPGQWVKTAGGRDVLVTFSPEYILRFTSITPAVEKMKRSMWQSLKAAAQRAAQERYDRREL